MNRYCTGVLRTLSAFLLCVLPAFEGALCLDVAAAESAGADTPQPVARWDFETPLSVPLVGRGQVQESSLIAPEFPDFQEQHQSLHLGLGSYLRIADHPDGRFDFASGDEITLEAWVRLDGFGQNAYLIGKGRTGNPGTTANNQSWALRLRSKGGSACVNFLFRSRPSADSPDSEGQWHRWTSNQGFTPGSGWHHVAVTYRFGDSDPNNIRGYLDGKQVAGRWDMDGATSRPPVKDDDEVWIGSTMKGDKSNSLHGDIDGIAIYRKVLPPETFKARYRYNPQPRVVTEVPEGKVAVQMYGPIASTGTIPTRVGKLLTTWIQDDLAFVQLPHRYDEWGIRQDWGRPLLVQATTDVAVPPGKHRILVRARGLSRLWIDDELVLTTRAQPNRAGAHHVVDPLPEVLFPGMRPHAMSEQEKVIEHTFEGQPSRFVLESIVGGPSYRPEFGENCVAIELEGTSMFTILAPQPVHPLTDEGWEAVVEKTAQQIGQQDLQNRRKASEASKAYWDKRHRFAVQNRMSDTPAEQGIDGLLAARLSSELQRAAGSETASDDQNLFAEQIEPILAQHCYRCHGEKEQGGLSLRSREKMLAGGESEIPAVVPGKPEESQLFELVSAAADDYRMPPQGDGLTEKQVAAVRTWIEQGAVVPAKPITATAEVTPVSSDEVFLRRVYLDTVGVAPSISEATEFLSSTDPDRRQKLIDQLLEDPRVADNWVGYWQDALAENPNLLKPTLNNTGPFRWWIHEALTDNKPLDRFATELIMMRGSTWDGGTAGFAVASQNDAPMAAKAYVLGTAFMGVQMKCARCHDAPYHQWKQGDLFQMAAMLERKPIKLPASSTVPPAFFAAQERESLIKATLKPGEAVQPEWPFADIIPDVPGELLENPDDSRERLAAQLTLSRRFAQIMVNRVWGRLMGLALVEPVDDWEGNPPSDPALLEYLADELIQSGYDFRHLCRTIMNSEAYQRTAIDREEGIEPESRFYAGPYRRRMTAEQVVDTAFHAVGMPLGTEELTMDVEGTLPPNTFLNFGYPERAWEFTTLANERDRPSLALPKTQAVADVLKAFGWRNSRPEPIAERELAANLIQPAVLANGTLGTWLTRLSEESGLTTEVLRDQPLETLVDRLFLTMLTRYPTDTEKARFVALLEEGYADRMVPLAEVDPLPEQERFRFVSWSNHLNSEANKIKVEMEERVRQGPPATPFIRAEWRTKFEDAVWSLLNAPEMVMIP